RDTLLTPLGYGLAELLSTDLAVSNRLVVVDRLKIDAILRELKLVDEGVTDPRGAPRPGRLIGARRLLIGSVSEASVGTLRVQARIVDVGSGTIGATPTAEAPLARGGGAEKAPAL